VKPHALIVEDEVVVRKVVKDYLSKRGFAVTVAASLDEARKALGSEKFSVAILDADLDGEYGLDLLPMFREADSQLPVIIYSGIGAEAETATLARHKGAAGFVSKLAPIEALWAVIEGAIETSRPVATDSKTRRKSAAKA
jgi:DNA-binding NtrC family response regulator